MKADRDQAFLQHVSETHQYVGRYVFHTLITRKLVITPFCVDNKLGIIVIGSKDCQILAKAEPFQYDNEKPVNNIVSHIKRRFSNEKINSSCSFSFSISNMVC